MVKDGVAIITMTKKSTSISNVLCAGTNGLKMNNEITNIDRTLNPSIDYLKICIPRNNNVSMIDLYDREGNKVPLIQELIIKLNVRSGITCVGKRVLRATKSQVMLDSKREVMTEDFTCPCVIIEEKEVTCQSPSK
jgi:hypothetical protein